MAIRSNIAKDVTPALSTIKEEFGLNYSGIAFSGLSVAPGTGGRSKWNTHIQCTRVFCSCGYSGAKAADDADWNTAGHCPNCGKPLINLTSRGWGSGKQENIKTCVVPITTIDGNIMRVDDVTFELSPAFPAHVMPTDADYIDPKYLEMMAITTSHKPVAEIEKKPDGSLSVTAHGMTNSIRVPKTDETMDFLGWQGELFLTARSGYEDLYTINFDVLAAAQQFPKVFSKENYVEHYKAWNEAFKLWGTSSYYSYDKSIIPKSATIEEFFEAKGYPLSVFSLDFEGRYHIDASLQEIEAFQETVIGKIISARVVNGQKVNAENMNDLIDIALVISGKRKSGRQGDNYDGYEGLFESFMKDALDHYGMEKNLVEIFMRRVTELRNNGVMPTEDSIRTRSFCSVINSSRYKLKKDGDIAKCISDSPIDALKMLQVRKDEA